MRILHTSDWHLGKRLFKLDRRQEHELFLDWLIETVTSENIDVLLMSGDVFDTPTPPHQSLELFYNFLHKLSTTTQVQSYFIAGNHDSGQLIEAPKALLKNHRVKVWGKLSNNIEDHWHRITINDESIDLCAIPFFRSYELLGHDEDILAALGKYLSFKNDIPKLLMLHHLAGMYEAGGSEQVISLTGIESIPTHCFDDFKYVALGHIHKPQKIKNHVYYSGSPLAMRFSEKGTKSVVIIDTKKDFEVSRLSIPTFRKIASIKTTEKELLNDLDKLEPNEGLTGIVEVEISLPSPRIGLIDQIKETLFKKNYELLSFKPVFANSEVEVKDKNKIFELSTKDLFKEFYLTKYSEETEVPEDVLEDFNQLLEKAQRAID
ncbi:MAG: exonuclease subunit SbcD [Bacteriovoracaceae bacterium]